MSLLDLARRWLRPGATAANESEEAERADFQKRAEALFLEYYYNSPYAHAKIKAGLRLTPEALDYMQREVDNRRIAAQIVAENTKEESRETNDSVALAPPGDVQRGGPGARDGDGGGQQGEAGSGGVDRSTPA